MRKLVLVLVVALGVLMVTGVVMADRGGGVVPTVQSARLSR
jgi:cytochrome b subunit of formate dehydrogenase